MCDNGFLVANMKLTSDQTKAKLEEKAGGSLHVMEENGF